MFVGEEHVHVSIQIPALHEGPTPGGAVLAETWDFGTDKDDMRDPQLQARGGRGPGSALDMEEAGRTPSSGR